MKVTKASLSEGGEELTQLRKISSTLESIERILEIQARPVIKAEIENLASTSERRKMWILCDGSRETEEAAKIVGTSARAVRYFASDGRRTGLISAESEGYPRRTIDFVPGDWKEPEAVEEVLPEPEEESAEKGKSY